MAATDAEAAFSFAGGRAILRDKDLGVFNGIMTAGTPAEDVFGVAGLYAPPLAAAGFRLDVRIGGDRIRTSDWTWHRSRIERRGRTEGIAAVTTTALVAGGASLVVDVTLHGGPPSTESIPVLVSVRGGIERTEAWEFHRPRERAAGPTETAEGGLVTLADEGDTGAALAVCASLPGCRFNPFTGTCTSEIRLGPGGRARFAVAVALGEAGAARRECRRILADTDDAVAGAAADDAAAATGLFSRLPSLDAAEPSLVSFYNRSLIALPLHRWDGRGLVVEPYYGVGSINGGVLGCYLWDFALGARMLALYDAQALRAHIRAFLEAGIDEGYGFNPATGRPFGSWYAVNPEKLVEMVRHYVVLTGDVSLLREDVRGRSVLAHCRDAAHFGEDPDAPPSLVDYRGETHHLELRRGFRYDHFVPDLNGRRFATYHAAADLCELVDEDGAALRRRAALLPGLLRKGLWNPGTGWFAFRDRDGRREERFTNEIFELLGSGVLDTGQEEALLSHLTDGEFLGPFGVHSISPLDPAYDPEDVDHGGPGSFVGIVTGLVERLYRSGRARLADDIFHRILWWGELLPYWGDSFYADRREYRQDTPYSAALPSVCGAQAVLFGLFGITVAMDGSVGVNPHPPSWSPRVALRGMQVRGLRFDVETDGTSFSVHGPGISARAPVGAALRIPAAG
jgi:hypothetical protein